MIKKRVLSVLCIVLMLSLSVVSYADENKDYVTISFAGDVALGTYEGGYNRFGDNWKVNQPFDYLAGVQAAFANDDITCVNLEGPLTTQKQVKVKEFSVKGEPEYVSILTSGSVEVCALANNHIGDCGNPGIVETKQILAQNNIAYALYDDVAVVERNGIVVAFLSYGCWGAKQYWKNLERDIANYKAVADVVCVSFHGGNEGTNKTVDYQRDTCRHAVDLGADIVVMEHAHVVQGIETYKNVPIVYGMGNFCFGLAKNPKDKDTFIFQADIAKDGTVLETRVIPCKYSSTDTINDYKPTIQPLDEAVRIVERLKNISGEFGTQSYFNFGDYLIYGDTVCFRQSYSDLLPVELVQ